jgi:hypothetical protein
MPTTSLDLADTKFFQLLIHAQSFLGSANGTAETRKHEVSQGLWRYQLRSERGLAGVKVLKRTHTSTRHSTRLGRRLVPDISQVDNDSIPANSGY